MSEKTLPAYGLMVKRHWQENCPQTYHQVQTEGTLEKALHEAREATSEEMMELRSKLQKELSLTPQQAHDQAWELIRENCVVLPPEETVSV